MKTCTKCGKEKPLEDFYRKARNKTDGRAPECKACARTYYDHNTACKPEFKEYKRVYNKARKKDLQRQYYELMLSKCCILCGESHIACLQFDHRDSSIKSFSIADGILSARSWSSIVTEMNKCDILCANCHAKRTALQFNWYANYFNDK